MPLSAFSKIFAWLVSFHLVSAPILLPPLTVSLSREPLLYSLSHYPVFVFFIETNSPWDYAICVLVPQKKSLVCSIPSIFTIMFNGAWHVKGAWQIFVEWIHELEKSLSTLRSVVQTPAYLRLNITKRCSKNEKMWLHVCIWKWHNSQTKSTPNVAEIFTGEMTCYMGFISTMSIIPSLPLL